MILKIVLHQEIVAFGRFQEDTHLFLVLLDVRRNNL